MIQITKDGKFVDDGEHVTVKVRDFAGPVAPGEVDVMLLTHFTSGHPPRMCFVLYEVLDVFIGIDDDEPFTMEPEPEELAKIRFMPETAIVRDLVSVLKADSEVRH